MPEPPAKELVWSVLVWSVLIWSVAVGSAGWALARLTGAERGWPWLQLMTFTPYVAIVAALGAIAAGVTRRWWAAGMAVAAAVALVACLLPRWVADPRAERVPHPGPAARFLTVNLRVGGADAGSIVALVRSHRVDVLALQEFTPDAQRRLDEAGLAQLLPHRVAVALPGVAGWPSTPGIRCATTVPGSIPAGSGRPGQPCSYRAP